MTRPVWNLCGPVIPISYRWRDESIPTESLTLGEQVCAFMEEYLFVPDGDFVGQPLRLEPFQVLFILCVFDNPYGTRLAILSIARKNAKSATIAGILLACLVGPLAHTNAQIVSGAMSREQAALIFNLACKMLNQSEDLRDIISVTPSSKRLRGLIRNTEFQALAAEGKTAMGLSPRIAVLDEVGQVQGPRSDFIDAITTAQGAHDNALVIVLSTQAATDADLLSIWIDDAASSQDPHTVCHVYTAPADCDLSDKDAWYAANPALGKFRSLRDLEEQIQKAVRLPSEENKVRNLLLNQRISVVTPFVSPNVWKACGVKPAPLQGMKVYGGLDLSARIDLTALILIGIDEQGKKHVHPYFWTPEKGLRERAKKDRVPYDTWHKKGFLRTTPGASVDYAHVVADMKEILADLDVEMIGFDRWRIDLFKKELESAEMTVPMAPYGQGFKDMSPALDILEADLLNERLCHGNHPVLSMCAANAVVTRDPAGNRKLDKVKATGRIDGLVALATAEGMIGNTEQEEEPQYQILVL